MFEYLQTIFCVVIIYTAIRVASCTFYQNPLLKFPKFPTTHDTSVIRRTAVSQGGDREVFLQGYQMFKDRPWRTTGATSMSSIIIPYKFIPELRSLPDNVLSFHGAVQVLTHSKYTNALSDVGMLPYAVKKFLTPSLRGFQNEEVFVWSADGNPAKLNLVLAEEIAVAVRTNLPMSTQWAEINITKSLVRMIASISGRVFVGSELCRDPEYLDAVLEYSKAMVMAIHAVSECSPYLRWLKASRLPEVKLVHERIEAAGRILRPIVAARREADDKPYDMLQWIIDSGQKFGFTDDKTLARYQLGISFAAVHNTTTVTSNALFTLAAMPDLIPMLREEVVSSLAESCGQFTTAATQRMRKLDSFLREIMRFYPLSATSFHRKILRDFTLSNCEVMPAGAFIELPTVGIYNDESIFPDHDKFDALRFYSVRQDDINQATPSKRASKMGNAQAVSVGPTNLAFGYGRHACPGRFFAINEIKILLAFILMNYDISLKDGLGVTHKNKLHRPLVRLHSRYHFIRERPHN